MTHNILCVADLDGTFVKNSVHVHPNDLQAYQKLTAYSDFAIATGRSVKEINYIADCNDLELTYAIGCNGAMIAEHDQVLFSKTLSPNDVDNLLDYLKKELETLTMRINVVYGICLSTALMILMIMFVNVRFINSTFDQRQTKLKPTSKNLNNSFQI